MIPFIGVLETKVNELDRDRPPRLNVPDLVGHVGQELRFTSVRQLSSFPRSGVLLNRVARVGHHLVDLRLQRVHLSARLDRDEPTEIAVHRRCRDLRETPDLRRQVARHGVDRHPKNKSSVLHVSSL